MANIGNFDASQIQPDEGIPTGDYLSTITDSQMKTTKAGTGQYLELTFQIIDGPYSGRVFWDRLTLQHPNQKTVDIAQRKLSSICRAVNILQISDTSALHNIPIKVRLKLDQDGDFGPQNEPKSYKPAGAAVAHQPQQQAMQQPPAQQQPAPWAGGPSAPVQPPVTQPPVTQPPGGFVTTTGTINKERPHPATPPWGNK